jgi:hypothetical protein
MGCSGIAIWRVVISVRGEIKTRNRVTASGRQLKSKRGPGFNLLNMFYFVLRKIFFCLIIFSWIACNKSSPKQPLFCL